MTEIRWPGKLKYNISDENMGQVASRLDMIRDAGQLVKIRDNPVKYATVGPELKPSVYLQTNAASLLPQV